MTQHEDFLVSPAHDDRGNLGGSVINYAYIGRYHCASDYKSKTGVKPATDMTRATFRTNIHNLGANIWQNDFAMFWTIRMLYLVEFANWDSQRKIGYGGGKNVLEEMGYTDNMPYHTGTSQQDKTTYGAGTQYRYIEGLWDNVYDWIDGIYFYNGTAFSRSYSVRCIRNPSDFSDTQNGTEVSLRSSGNGVIKNISNITSSSSPLRYAFYPNSASGFDYDLYITDGYEYNSKGTVLFAGGAYDSNYQYGLFYLNGSLTSNSTMTSGQLPIGSRLMVLPPSRLTA